SGGSITINNAGNTGQVSVEGTVLDIDSLTFVGAGTLATTGSLTLDASTTVDIDGDTSVTLSDGGTLYATLSQSGTQDLSIDAAGNNVIIADSDALDVYGALIGIDSDADADNYLALSDGGRSDPSGSLYWGNRILCDTSGNCTGGSGGSKWQQNLGVLSPYSSTLDVAVGGSATSSASFQAYAIEQTGGNIVSLTSDTITNGNVLSATASAITTGSLLKLGQGGNSAFSGNVIWADIDNTGGGGGTFTGDFLQFDNAQTTVFDVNYLGAVRASDLTLGLNDTSATITTQDTNEDLTLDPNGTGDVYFNGATYNISDTGDLTIGGRITFENAGYIQNESNGTIEINEPTILLTGATSVDVNSPLVDLSTQATDFEIIDANASALTISQSTNNYLVIDTSGEALTFGNTSTNPS
ncbi:MAG: hypothetical protein ACWGQW_22840, partial [bacterium]